MKKITASPNDTEKQQNEVVTPETAAETVADDSSQPKAPGNNKAPSNAKLTLQRFKKVREELITKGINPSQRNILMRIGGSFTTIAKLQRQLEMLEADPIDISIEVSDEAIAACKADIVRHLEGYRDTVKEKLDRIEAGKNEMSDAIEIIQSLQIVITELDHALTDAEQTIAGITDKCESLVKENIDLKQALNTATDSLAEVEKLNSKLEEEKMWLTGCLVEAHGLWQKNAAEDGENNADKQAPVKSKATKTESNDGQAKR
jgi:chromosome segregation ATPase